MADDVVDVVGLVGGVGDDRVQGTVGIRRLPLERALVLGDLREVVVGKKAQHRADVVDRVVLVFGEVVGNARPGVVRIGAAELFHADVLAGDGLDDIGARDEHLARLVDHDDKVGEGGGVHGATGGRPHDDRDLRDDTRRARVESEDLTVFSEGDHTLLDARAARVQDADDRHPAAKGQLHDLDDLLAGYFAERSAEGREVLCVDRYRAAMDGAGAGDHRVAVGARFVHPERRRAVAHIFVQLGEAAGIDEQLDALAGRELALRVLLLAG